MSRINEQGLSLKRKVEYKLNKKVAYQKLRLVQRYDSRSQVFSVRPCSYEEFRGAPCVGLARQLLFYPRRPQRKLYRLSDRNHFRGEERGEVTNELTLDGEVADFVDNPLEGNLFLPL